MSKILRCDLCGKQESKKIVIDNHALKLQLPTKNGLMNFYINVQPEKNKAKDAVETFQHEMARMGITCPDDADELEEDDFMKVFQMQDATVNALNENMDTCVCRQCKLEILKLGLGYGSFSKLKNIFA